MTPQQIHLVRSSYALVAPIAPAAARIFYDRLFAIDPSLRSLFRGDMTQQGQKLMEMIGVAVGLLDKPQHLLPALRHLGRRHAGYGVNDGHYATVGRALLETLEIGLGDGFDAATRQAWSAMYALVSSTMCEAAAEAGAAAVQ